MILHILYFILFSFAVIAVNFGLLRFLMTREHYHDSYDEILYWCCVPIPILGTFGLIFAIFAYYADQRRPERIAYWKDHAAWVERVEKDRRRQEITQLRHEQGIYTPAEKKVIAEEKKIMDRWKKAQLGVIKK